MTMLHGSINPVSITVSDLPRAEHATELERLRARP